MFIANAFAQANEAGALSQGSLSGTLIQLGLIFAIFYLFLIRPQQKKFKQHENMLKAIKKGDNIVTGGGVYGKVIKAEENSSDVVVEIADGVNIVVNRGTIREVVENKTVVAKNDNKKSKK